MTPKENPTIERDNAIELWVEASKECDRLENELAAANENWRAVVTCLQAAQTKRDAAIARAEVAERERDEVAKHRDKILAENGRLLNSFVAAERKLAMAVEGFEIIAGKRQCLDNLMGNCDVANAALSELKKGRKDENT